MRHIRGLAGICCFLNEQNEKNSSLIGLALPLGGGSADRRYAGYPCLASILGVQEVWALEFAGIIALLGKVLWRSNLRSPVFWLEMSAWAIFIIAVDQYGLAARVAFEEKWQHRVSSRLNGNQVPQIDVVKDVGGLIASSDRCKADRKYFSPIPARADFDVVCGGGREFQATLYLGVNSDTATLWLHKR